MRREHSLGRTPPFLLQKSTLKIQIFKGFLSQIKNRKHICERKNTPIDVYFTEYLLAVEIDEKGHTDIDLIFEEKRKKALEEKLGCKFIRISTSKEGYDADYEASRIQRQTIKKNKN